MVFTSKKVNNLPNLILNDRIINRVHKTKFLGITYDESLTFKDHISNISIKLARSLALLSQARSVAPPEILKLLYYADIYPHLHYCSPVWTTIYPTLLSRLILLKKKPSELSQVVTTSLILPHCSNRHKFSRYLILWKTDTTIVFLRKFCISQAQMQNNDESRNIYK